MLFTDDIQQKFIAKRFKYRTFYTGNNVSGLLLSKELNPTGPVLRICYSQCVVVPFLVVILSSLQEARCLGQFRSARFKEQLTRPVELLKEEIALDLLHMYIDALEEVRDEKNDDIIKGTNHA